MNILLLNYPYLQNELKEIGHNVFSIGNYSHCNHYIPILSYEEIITKVNIDQFDLIIYSDGLDKHPLVSNFNKFSLPKIYISIDSTINYFWQKYFIRSFDIIFVDQLSVYEKMRNIHSRVYPLLLSYDDKIFFKENGIHSNDSKKYDITFIGRRNDNTRIKRTNILDKIISAGLKINLIDGEDRIVSDQKELASIYNQSKIVLNESLFPSINLRLFEVLGSGALLFNEESDNYIKEYFQDKIHLVYYNQDNLIERLNYYLENDIERNEIANRGYISAKKYHKDLDRAKFMINIIEENIKDVKYNSKKTNITLSEAVTALHLNSKWNNSSQVDIPEISLFNQNSKIIYNTISNNSINNKILSNDNELLFEYLLLCYSLSDNEKIIIILKEIDILKLNTKYDYKLIQFIFFYTLEKKTSSNIKYQKNIDLIITHLILPNLNEEDNKSLQNNLSNEKTYLFYFAKYLETFKNIERINFGFTQINISPIFFTQFDFYHLCMKENIKFEESVLGMIRILITAKAYDNVYSLYNILNKKHPHNITYIEEAKRYRHLSFL